MRRWSAADYDQAHALLDDGHGYDVIAQRLGRSRIAVELKCQSLGQTQRSVDSILSCAQIAALLGLPCQSAVTRWIARGWLWGRNVGTPQKALWRIPWDDLQALLEAPQTWMAWHPALITDPAIRDWARALRQDRPQWRTLREVGARYGVSRGVVNRWVREGSLPATRYWGWWVYEGDLEGWVPGTVREGRTWTPILDPAHLAAAQWRERPRDLLQFRTIALRLFGMGLDPSEVAVAFDMSPNVFRSTLGRSRRAANIVYTPPRIPFDARCVCCGGQPVVCTRALCNACGCLARLHGTLKNYPYIYGWKAKQWHD